MKSFYGASYQKCLELSKLGTYESLKELMEIYLYSENKGSSKNAKSALKRSWNKKIVRLLIDEFLKSNEFDKYSLLYLGVSIFRQKYLKLFLSYTYENSIDLISIGFYKAINLTSLSEVEQRIIISYIVEYGDFQLKLIELLDEQNRQKLVIEGINLVKSGVIKKGILKFLSSDKNIVREIQFHIHGFIKSDSVEDKSLIRYVDLSDLNNQEWVFEGTDFLTTFLIVKDNLFSDDIVEFINTNVSACYKIINSKELSENELVVTKAAVLKKIDTFEDIDKNKNFLVFLEKAYYVDKSFIEEQLISIYLKTKLYTDKALMILAQLGSQFAYRELLSLMLVSENYKNRHSYAVQLIRNFKGKASTIYNYAKETNDEKFIKFIEEISRKFNVVLSIEEKYELLNFDSQDNIQILSENTVISELLIDLANNIGATSFYAAVGFTFSSGLKMLQPLFDTIRYNNGVVELVTGSLQDFDSNGRNTKIDRGSVSFLNFLIEKVALELYTFTESFYHGKFYYLSNEEKAYVIVGSSNISKTAFLDNYELNTLIVIDTKKSNKFLKWYQEFKEKCIKIEHIDESLFDDFKWESELESYSSRYITPLSTKDMQKRIEELSDEETRLRLESWMRHRPSEIFSNLSISSLSDYIVFLYPENGLAVFESFTAGNAYYTFKYHDFDKLLKDVAYLTKTQLITLSNFVSRGYHVSDREKLEHKISKLFVEQSV